MTQPKGKTSEGVSRLFGAPTEQLAVSLDEPNTPRHLAQAEGATWITGEGLVTNGHSTWTPGLEKVAPKRYFLAPWAKSKEEGAILERLIMKQKRIPCAYTPNRDYDCFLWQKDDWKKPWLTVIDCSGYREGRRFNRGQMEAARRILKREILEPYIKYCIPKTRTFNKKKDMYVMITCFEFLSSVQGFLNGEFHQDIEEWNHEDPKFRAPKIPYYERLAQGIPVPERTTYVPPPVPMEIDEPAQPVEPEVVAEPTPEPEMVQEPDPLPLPLPVEAKCVHSIFKFPVYTQEDEEVPLSQPTFCQPLWPKEETIEQVVSSLADDLNQLSVEEPSVDMIEFPLEQQEQENEDEEMALDFHPPPAKIPRKQLERLQFWVPSEYECNCEQCITAFVKRNKNVHSEYVLYNTQPRHLTARERRKITQRKIAIDRIKRKVVAHLFSGEDLPRNINKIFPKTHFKEYPHTQGDEQLIEQAAEVSKTANITFVEEREIVSDSTHTSGEISALDPNKDIAEDMWHIIETLTREILIYQGLWTAASQDAKVFPIPGALFKKFNSMVVNQCKIFEFLRAGVTIRVQLNGYKFAAGRLIVYLRPPYWKSDHDKYDKVNYTCFPHVFIDASTSNVAILKVPFTHFLTHFAQRKDRMNNTFMTLGQLVVEPYNALRVGTGGISELSYSVYMKLDNPEPHQVTYPIDQFSYSEAEGIVIVPDVWTTPSTQGLEGMLKGLATRGVSAGVSMADKMTGGLVTGVGDTVAKFFGMNCDKPTDPLLPQPVANRTLGNICHGVGVDQSTRLALTPISQTETSAAQIGSVNPDFNLLTLAKIPSLLFTQKISTSTLVSLIAYVPVCPQYVHYVGLDGNSTKYTVPMVAYVSRPCLYWRGPLIYKFQAVTSQMHSLRLALVYNPAGTTNSKTDMQTIDRISNLNTVIYDIEEHKEFEIKIPYTSPKPWLKCSSFNFNNESDPKTNQLLGETFSGYLSIYVWNKLVAPTNVSQEIDLNIFVYAGDGFELAYPGPLDPLCFTPQTQTLLRGVLPTYPFIQGIENDILFQNHTLIDNLYAVGADLYMRQLITDNAKDSSWFLCVPYGMNDTDDGINSDEATKWYYDAQILSHYEDDTPQKKYMVKLRNYSTLYKSISRPVTQGLEENTTTRDNEAPTLTITKSATSKEIAPQTISENAMNLGTLLKRFYPLFHEYLIPASGGYTVVTWPVSPSHIPEPRANYGWYLRANPINHIAWYSRLFTYFRGSLRYKIVFDSPTVAIALHAPQMAIPYRVSRCADIHDLNANMALASVIAHSNTQNVLEIEVPYASTYNQLLLDAHSEEVNLVSCNGSILLYLSNQIASKPTSFQVFISLAEDSVFNVIKPPSYVYSPQYVLPISGSKDNKVIDKIEMYRSHGDTAREVVLPALGPYSKFTTLGAMKAKGCMPSGIPPSRFPETQYLCQSACTSPGHRLASERRQAISYPNCFRAFGGDLHTLTQFYKSYTHLHTLPITRTYPHTQALTDWFIPASVQNFITEATGSVRRVNAAVDRVENVVSSVGTGPQDINFYANLSVNLLMLHTLIDSFHELYNHHSVANVIKFGTQFATLLGYNFSHSLKILVNNIAHWSLGIGQLPQTQALNEDALNFFEGHETKIIPVVAVLGTILYAYLFDVIPNAKALKAMFRKFFEDEIPKEKPRTQAGVGDHLKAAHFSVLGIKAIGVVYEKLCTLIQQFVDWLLQREDPAAVLERKAATFKDRVLNLIKTLDHLDNEVEMELSLQEPDIHNKFYVMMDDAEKLMKDSLNEKLDSRVQALIKETYTKARALIKTLEKLKPSHTVRYDPFVVCIHGTSGTGKTALMRVLADKMMNHCKFPKFNRYYSKSDTSDGFWNNYKNQQCVLWDEFGQNRNAKDAIADFVTLRGNDPHQLSMASLEDKGRYFTSKLIIMTTNVPYERFAEDVRFPEAFLRRRNIMIGTQHRTGDANTMQQQKGWDMTWSHSVFAVTDNMRHAVKAGKTDMNLEQITEYCCKEFEAWNEKQMEALQQLNDEITDMVLPRGVYVKPQENGEQDDLPAVLDLYMEEHHYDELISDTSSQFSDFVNAVDLPQTQALTRTQSDTNISIHSNSSTDSLVAKFDQIAGPPLPPPIFNTQHPQDTTLVDSDVDDDFQDALTGNFNIYAPVPEPTLKINPVVFLKSNEKLTPEEEFKRDLFLARVRELSAETRIKFRQAKNVAKIKVSYLYKLAVTTFKNIAQRIKDYIKDHPKISTVIGLVMALSTAGLVFFSTRRGETEGAYESNVLREGRQMVRAEGTYETGPARAGRTIVKSEGAYETGVSRVSKPVVRSEGCEDPSAMQIMPKIHNNLHIIQWNTSTRRCTMRALHIGGSIILAPYHFFRGANANDEFIFADRDFYFQPDNLVRLNDYDWALYDCGPRLAPRKKLVKYFVSEKSLSKIGKPNALLLLMDPCSTKVYTNVTAKSCRVEYFDSRDNSIWYMQQGWEYLASTASGDCGSPLMAMTSAIEPPGKVLGIHVAGFSNKSFGYSVLITREKLEEAWFKFNRTQVLGMPIPKEIDRNLPMSQARVIPEGDYSYYGVMPNSMSPLQPQKSTFLKTPFYDLASMYAPAPKKPAHLFKFMKDGEMVSPLKKALTKFGKKTVPFPPRLLSKVKEFMVHYLAQEVPSVMGKRVVKEQEAILGVAGLESAARINMNSSPGWPYQVLNKKESGKHYLFDQDYNIINPELRKRLDEREEKARKLKRVPSVWRDCLKDELRPNEKVDAGKSRLFTIAPVDFTILVRKYFLDFTASFYERHNRFFSAVGINPESYEWTQLYNYLKEYGTQTIAGDFGTFDGTLPPELIEMAGDIINAWYGDSVENQNVRRTLINEIIHTMQLVENSVYATHQGNPSGNPLTVVINSIVHILYLLLAFLIIFPNATCQDFIDNIRAVVYGDDNVIVVRRGWEAFNQNKLTEIFASFGIEYTTELKDGVEVGDFRELDNVTFLKRGFRRDPEVGSLFVLPTMALDTMNSFFYWMRTSDDPETQLQMNMKAGLTFASFHGRDFYNKYLNRWKFLMSKVNFKPIHIGYDEQIDIFLYTCGIDMKSTEGSVDKFMKITNSKVCRALMGTAQALPYYLCAAMNGMTMEDDTITRDDDRWAVAIPSGEGKSYLCRQFPHIFVDHDDLLLPKFSVTKLLLGGDFPWSAEQARENDFPPSDRRILLVHHPDNTRRQIVGSFITHFPKFVRINAFQRLKLKEPYKLDRDTRNQLLLEFARKHEPDLFLSSCLNQPEQEDSCLNQPEFSEVRETMLNREPAQELEGWSCALSSHDG